MKHPLSFAHHRPLVEAAGGDPAIIQFVEALVTVAEGTSLRESNYGRLLEKWSDAARAASHAARKAKGKGGDWRKAGAEAYYKVAGRPKTSRTERNMGIAKAASEWHSGQSSRAYRMGSRADTALGKIGIRNPVDSFDRLAPKHISKGTLAQRKYFARKFRSDTR